MVKEDSCVLEISHPNDPAWDKAVDAEILNHKKSFMQETVLQFRTTVCATFCQMVPKENTLDPVRTATGQERQS
ncbi:MAG: hypothetical protein LLF99_10335 [Desulfobacteraceae bacterium]|nr:hypothetical protein [Desulfobacteraceae bacterium]